MNTSKRVHVHILDKEYQVACPPEEREALLSAAEELDSRMRQIRNSGAVLGSDRLAVMVALNLCYELQQNKNTVTENPNTEASLKRISDKMDEAIALQL